MALHVLGVVYDMADDAFFVDYEGNSPVGSPLLIVDSKCFGRFVAWETGHHHIVESAVLGKGPLCCEHIGARGDDLRIYLFELRELLLEPNKLPLSAAGEGRSIKRHNYVLLTLKI